MQQIRSVFFVSDRTGVTVENLGSSLLHQFDEIKFNCHTIPFIDSFEEAQKVLQHIIEIAEQEEDRPIVFSSIVDRRVRESFDEHHAFFHVDFFNTFIPGLEAELGERSHMMVGSTHGITDERRYDDRMEAVNFALINDDGVTEKNYNEADIILIGVSRSGKTPTCLYLALQYGILAANYPLTPDDLGKYALPRMIKNHRDKLFGLTIDSNRLNRIRNERRPDSEYASLSNCDYEVHEAEMLFNRYNIPYISSTNKSVEELVATILQVTNLRRRF